MCLGEFAVRKTLESALNVPTNEKNAGIWQKCSLLEKGEGESASGTAAGDRAQAGWRLAIRRGRGVGSRSDAGEASGGDQVRAERWQPLRRERDADGCSNASEVSTSYSETCEALEAFGDKTCEERLRGGRPMRAPTINAVAPHAYSKAAEKKKGQSKQDSGLEIHGGRYKI